MYLYISLNYNLNSFKIYFYDKEVLINEQIDENLSLKYLRVIIDKNKKFSENFYFEDNKKRINFKKEENIKIKEIIINNDNKILLKNYFKLIISYQIKKNEQNDNVTNVFDINLKNNLDLFREKLIKEILKTIIFPLIFYL